jgi:hypothetical protein
MLRSFHRCVLRQSRDFSLFTEPTKFTCLRSGGRSSKSCVGCFRNLEHQELALIRTAEKEAKQVEKTRWDQILHIIESDFIV